jgi:hypothetical protein
VIIPCFPGFLFDVPSQAVAMQMYELSVIIERIKHFESDFFSAEAF